ncbi:sensor histidine kinase [Microbulbifer sp. TYP-18]|uniref:sensor histidine kinase n=1 Tax=Microbulbifer sp. TYP-18 TaxID=3230024 RepID=UPI0034C6CE59
MSNSQVLSFPSLLLPSWRRLRTVLIASLIWSLPLGLTWQSSYPSLLLRILSAGLVALLVFSVLERWPREPRRMPRWVLQVLGVSASIPISLWAIYVGSTEPGAPPFWQDHHRAGGFAMLTIGGLLTAPWIAMAALLRQRDAAVRNQARAFERERGELERQALDARLRLLQAQVTPHFLFNTLANVRELVESASPRAPALLDSLIAYLRAAVPGREQVESSFDRELSLVRAYLELMQMRIPDRLQYAVAADTPVKNMHCPPMALLTLVENAVRHGIDPSEAGGRIDVRLRLVDGRCLVQVADTGAGIESGAEGLGTGLATLRERLRLTFGDQASLRLIALEPQGLLAEMEFPAQEAQ